MSSITAATTKELEAFEMWLFRRMLTIPMTAHVANMEALRRMKKHLEVMLRQIKIDILYCKP